MIDYNNLVPRCIKQILLDQNWDIDQLPFKKKIHAGVLFTDVVGFTKLTEKISNSGYYAIETITEILNTYFDRMHDIILNYGGDLIKYGGDSILAIFPDNQLEATNRMHACLYAMHIELIELNKIFLEKYSVEISFHSNINWGEICINLVGNPHHHLDFFVTGEPFMELFGSEITEIIEITDYSSYQNLPLKYKLPNEQIDIFTPKRVKNWLKHHNFSGELKNCATLFINVFSLNDKQISLINYHNFYIRLQDIIYFFDGTINKIDYNDKGYMILITFGVPYTHHDDIARAFVCGNKISNIKQNDICTKIGLTYNNIYSGILGAKQFYEFGIIGNAVNISARLMNEASPNEVIFSDEVISKISGRYDVEYIKSVSVKGIDQPIRTYRVSNEISDLWNTYQSRFAEIPLYGYVSELEQISKSKLNLIIGNTGTGKSHLIYTYLNNKKTKGSNHLIISLSEYDSLKPLNIVYKILKRRLLIREFPHDLVILKDYIIDNNLKISYQIIEDYFLKQDLINIDQRNVAFDLISELIVFVLDDVDNLVLENHQWLDQTSSTLVIALIPRLLALDKQLIITSRTAELEKTLRIFKPEVINTKGFDFNLTKQFLSDQQIPVSDKVIYGILKATQNNPGFIIEYTKIINNLWDKSRGIFDSDELNALIRKGKLPNSMETILLNEYEALDNDIKQILKYASIIGVSFSDNLLNIFSETFISKHIDEVLKSLGKEKIVLKKIILPEIEYFFNNSLMRDAIYHTILFNEKQQIHLTIAQYYIDNYQDELSNYYELIANHFIQAKDTLGIKKWCNLAATKNYNLSSFSSCYYYYSMVLKHTKDETDKIEVKLALAQVLLNQNKAKKTSEILETLNPEILENKELEDYYLALIKLYELQKEFDKFQSTVELISNKIKSLDFLLKVKLISFDYYRINNYIEPFKITRNEIRKYLKTNPKSYYSIRFFSILGQYYLDKANYPEATENYQKLELLALESNNRVFQRISYTSLGIIQMRLGNQSEAVDFFQKALVIAEEIGNKHGYGKVLTELAMVYFSQGNHAEALKALQNCLQIARYVGDKQQEQIVLYNYGYINNVIEKFEESIKYLTAARDIAELINDKVGVSFANDGLGDAYLLLGDPAKAKSTYLENLILQKKLKDTEGIAHTIGNLANVYRDEKKFDKAIEYYAQQQTTLAKLGDKIGEGKAFFNWGITDEMLGNIEEAKIKLNKSYDLFQAANDQNYSDFVKEQIDRINNISK